MKNLSLVMLAVLMLVPFCANGEGQKIGFVNASVLFQQYSVAREAEEAYGKELEEINKQVAEMEIVLRSLADTLEARKYLFSEERLKEKTKELERKQQEYVKFRQDAEMTAARRNDELSGPIVAAIEEATKRVAEKEGFDLVLDAGPGIVVYSKPELDITDEVLEDLEVSRGSTE
ncbi:MAG: OmpH family outer membrane protein [Candidatus Eisenbacteria bacterium]